MFYAALMVATLCVVVGLVCVLGAFVDAADEWEQVAQSESERADELDAALRALRGQLETAVAERDAGQSQPTGQRHTRGEGLLSAEAGGSGKCDRDEEWRRPPGRQVCSRVRSAVPIGARGFLRPKLRPSCRHSVGIGASPRSQWHRN